MQRHSVAYYVYLFLINCCIPSLYSRDLYGADEESYSKNFDFESPKLIQQQAGWDVKLRCGILGNHAEFMSLSDVYWDFKNCGDGYNQTSCRKQNGNNKTSPWTKIICEDKPCTATLLVRNPTEKNSGLYRCSIQPYKPNDQTTLQIQVVKTYQLDVINFTIAAPELIDELPANTTALADSQVVLQCLVHSKVPPSIKWFRKQDTAINFPLEAENYNSKVIQYFESTYELLESAGEKGLTEDTYLSKLILNNVSERDTGFYVCVGINYRGFKIREAYLNILYPEEIDVSNSRTKDLFLLFLIPIGLAIIPITLWCCYILVKCINNKQTSSKQKRSSDKSRRYTEVNVK